MADVNIDDLVEVVVKGKFFFVDDVLNVFQAKMTDPGDGTAATTVTWAQEWIDDLYDELLAQLTTDYEIDSIEVDNLTQGTFLGQDFTPKTFTGAGDALPPSVCGLIIARTAEQSIQGRKYLGVFEESQQNNGIFIAAARTAMAAFATLWRSSFTDAALTVGLGQVVTKFPIGPPVGRDIISTRVISGTRTQRRRTVGVGS